MNRPWDAGGPLDGRARRRVPSPAVSGPPVEDVVARVPGWSGGDVGVELLKGGLSHRIYVVTVDGGRHVLRILNPAVSDAMLGVAPELEIENTVRAARSGVGPAVEHVLADVPAIVLEYLDGETLDYDRTREAGMIPRLGEACRRLHDGTPPFANRFSIFRHREGFLDLCRRHDLRMPDGYAGYDGHVRRIEDAVTARPLPEAACHNDLLAENFIDDGRRVRIVDYQLSGMSDPAFELGDVAAEGDYDPDRVGRLCEAYFGAELDDHLMARVRLYLVMSNVTWTLWFSIHHGLLRNPDADFDYWAEAADKWGQAVRDLEAPGFGALLEAARGP
jgi:thiamine kinase-like enzyme